MGTWSFTSSGSSSGSSGINLNTSSGGGGGTGGTWLLASPTTTSLAVATNTGSEPGVPGFFGSDPFGINPAVAISERDMQSVHYLGDSPILNLLEPPLANHGYRNVLIFAGLLIAARYL